MPDTSNPTVDSYNNGAALERKYAAYWRATSSDAWTDVCLNSCALYDGTTIGHAQKGVQITSGEGWNEDTIRIFTNKSGVYSIPTGQI